MNVLHQIATGALILAVFIWWGSWSKRLWDHTEGKDREKR